jgi:hypothetical protein
VSLRILKSDLHPRTSVDPFGQLPCEHDVMRVYITNGETIGHDLLECSDCGYVVTLQDLYSAFKMPPGLLPGSG